MYILNTVVAVCKQISGQFGPLHYDFAQQELWCIFDEGLGETVYGTLQSDYMQYKKCPPFFKNQY